MSTPTERSVVAIGDLKALAAQAQSLADQIAAIAERMSAAAPEGEDDDDSAR